MFEKSLQNIITIAANLLTSGRDFDESSREKYRIIFINTVLIITMPLFLLM